MYQNLYRKHGSHVETIKKRLQTDNSSEKSLTEILLQEKEDLAKKMVALGWFEKKEAIAYLEGEFDTEQIENFRSDLSYEDKHELLFAFDDYRAKLSQLGIDNYIKEQERPCDSITYAELR